MFIYHFNRMIRNRILWLVFAIFIAIAFLSVDSCYRRPSGNGSSNNQEAGAIGGEAVSYDEYEFARRFVENATRDLSPAATETQIWAHIAAMRTAKEMGITVSPSELSEIIANTPAFQQNGVFNKGVYAEVLSRNLGVAPSTYEHMLADQIALTKLMSVVTAGMPASQMAIEDEAAARTDTFTFRYATISNKFATAEINPDDEALKAYYDENNADFALPDRVAVRYVSLPVTNFSASVEIADIDIEDYYESDPSRYTRQGTNGVEQLTLDEARDQILDELVLVEAAHVAVTNLAAFMDAVATNDLETFTWRAKARGLKTADTPLFSFDSGYIPGVEAAAIEEFRECASDLDLQRADALYGIARGKRQVYLMRVMTNDLAHTPTFESLKDTLVPLVTAEKRAKLFSDDAEKIAGEIKAAMSAKDFAGACGDLALNVSTSITFSATSLGADPFDNARAIVPEVIRVKKGDLSKPINVFGGAVVAYVENREPADSFEAASAREAVASQLSQMESSAAFADWINWNLNSKGFTSKRLDAILSDIAYGQDDIED